MARAKPRTVLFLCTGNFYRSRFAECLFNATAAKMGLPWRATSRGLALERGVNNVGPMAVSAVKRLQANGIQDEQCARLPTPVAEADFAAAAIIIALQDAEHRPLLLERHPVWAERVEYWHVEDADGALVHIEREMNDLIARLLGGKKADASVEAPPPRPAPETPKEKPLARVGRETKGRRGKGVTTVFDLALDEDALRELAATLKQRCGTGGTVKDGCIEIQGDQRDRVSAVLEELGYKVKRSGG